MVELRLLTEEAKKTRFDFVWQVEGCDHLPVFAVSDGERALRLALEEMIRYKWTFQLQEAI